jgi:hypothetical protein
MNGAAELRRFPGTTILRSFGTPKFELKLRELRRGIRKLVTIIDARALDVEPPHIKCNFITIAFRCQQKRALLSQSPSPPE